MTIDRPIAIALLLFIILLLVFFLAVPEYNTFKNLRTELSEKTAEFNAEFDYYAAITRTHYDLQSRRDDIKKIDNALPSAEDVNLGKLIYFLQETAEGNGMIMKNLFLSKSSAADPKAGASEGVKDLIFSASVIGDYESLGKFIVSLEKSSRIFEVTNISFGSGSSSSLGSSQSQFQTQRTYNFNLQIKTHSY